MYVDVKKRKEEQQVECEEKGAKKMRRLEGMGSVFWTV